MDYPISFFDVETPNRHNNKICSIAVVITDQNGTVLDEVSTLVNPEDRFDDKNMQIHGICPADVKNAPSFPDVWESTLRRIFEDTLVAAHGARFDMGVISKCAREYGLGNINTPYACTLDMAKHADGLDLPDYKLPTLCKALDVSLGHHHEATSDAEACMGVFWKLAQPKQIPFYFSPYYPPTPKYHFGHSFRYADKTLAMRKLISSLESVLTDGEVSVDEAQEVLDLISTNDLFFDDPVLVDICESIQTALSDGDLSQEESDSLKKRFETLVSPVSDDAPCQIEFEGKNFVLSGTFEHGSKASIEEMICSRGGVILKSVTKKCDYLLVGGQGSEAWAYGNYGSKVKKALDMQEKGHHIEIVGEHQLFECL